jgi:hypothetical protein
MSDTQPDKTDRQINEQSKANLGQKDAQLEKDKGFRSLPHGREIDGN